MTDKYVAYWKQKQVEHRQKSRELARIARQELTLVVEHLVERYGVTEIILFGSLAKGQFSAGSDIDLAVAGLPPAEFFTAYAEVNRLTRFAVDLKPLESLHTHFRNRVLARGEIIYETSDSR